MSRRPGISAVAESEGEEAVIFPQLKLPAFYLEPEMLDGAESCQQLPVECAIRNLSMIKLFGEEP